MRSAPEPMKSTKIVPLVMYKSHELEVFNLFPIESHLNTLSKREKFKFTTSKRIISPHLVHHSSDS